MEREPYYVKSYGGYIYGYCSYCKHPINEEDNYIEKNGEIYHYSKNPLETCYFGEDE